MKKIKLLFICWIIITFNGFSQAPKIDSLQRELAEVQQDTSKCNLLLEISKAYLKEGNKDSALLINNQLIELSRNINDRRRITKAMLNRSNIIFKQGKSDSSRLILKEYLKELDETDSLDYADVNYHIGYKFYLNGNNVESLLYYLEALNTYERSGKELRIYNSLRYAYSRIGEKREALRYTNKMLDVCPDTNYKALANIYLNKGYYETVLGDNITSLASSKEGMSIFRIILNDTTSYTLGLVHTNIAEVYLYAYEYCPDSIRVFNPYMKDVPENKINQMILDSAKYSIDKFAEILKVNKMKSFESAKLYGRWNIIQGKKAKALDFFEQAFNQTEGSKAQSPDRRDLAFDIFKLYREKGREDKAFDYYEEYIYLKDSLNNEEKFREVGQKEAKFEFERQKEAELARRAKERAIEQAKLEQERAIAKEKERNQSIVNYSMILGVLLISAFTIFFSKKLKVTKEQQKLIAIQKQTIEKNRNHMLESIEYSKNIQKRIFPTMEEVKRLLPNSFVYFKPKDVVSGDFYWVHRKGNKTFFSVADCTGHGVPGAFMTLISLNLLNAIILEEDVTSTNLLLERLHIKLKERLTSSEEEQMKHGLDIAMCAYDHTTGKLEYSGLHNPLYIINKDNELREIKGDNLFLGISKYFNVTLHQIEIKKGDSCYMSTDGFPDQKGGEKGKKFYYSRFRNLLRVVNTYSVDKRVEILDKKFNEWKGDKEQIDDICIMGVTFD